MNQVIFSIVSIALLALAVLLQMRYSLLNDVSTATVKPFSYARVQLTWWTFIVLSIFISIIIVMGQIPTLDKSTLILLGLGALTTGAARIIDISDTQNSAAATAAGGTAPKLNVDQPRVNFILDILSDNNGVSIHRLQAVLFNLVFGLWFIYKSFMAIKGLNFGTLNTTIPTLEDHNLILLGLSAGTYAAMKTTENK